MEIIYEQGNFTVAAVNKNDLEYESFQRLRTLEWSKEGREKVPPGQLEVDEFDQSAVYIVALHHNQFVGGYRLIMADDIKKLPFSKYCESTPTTAGPAVEISRWCTDQRVPTNVRSIAHMVMMRGALVYFATKKTYEHVYVDVCDSLFNHCSKIGVSFDQLGKKHLRPDGSVFVPARVKLSASAGIGR